jgi:hypothetical protein
LIGADENEALDGSLRLDKSGPELFFLALYPQPSAKSDGPMVRAKALALDATTGVRQRVGDFTMKLA